MNRQGFSKLTPEEYLVLSAFPEDGEIGFPVDCGFDTTRTVQILEALRRKDSIVGRAPYRLTKKGLKELQQWKNSSPS